MRKVLVLISYPAFLVAHELHPHDVHRHEALDLVETRRLPPQPPRELVIATNRDARWTFDMLLTLE